MSFHVLEELPQEDEAAIRRILAIPATKRSAGEAAYLTARSDYLDNRIEREDEDGLMALVSGFSVPANGQPGFSKGAKFIERDAAGGTAATYENIGTTTACEFVLMGTGAIGSFADNETPSGLVNSSNAVYTLAHTPLSGSLQLFRNGILQIAGTNYTLVGATITFVSAPSTGNTIRASYRY